jgi:hypothetical protein
LGEGITGKRYFLKKELYFKPNGFIKSPQAVIPAEGGFQVVKTTIGIDWRSGSDFKRKKLKIGKMG